MTEARPEILAAKLDRLAAVINDGPDPETLQAVLDPSTNHTQADAEAVVGALSKQAEAASDVLDAAGSVREVEQVTLPSERSTSSNSGGGGG